MDKNVVLDGFDHRRYYTEKVVSLKINGKAEAVGLCPFHDDRDPSFSVNLENGLWRCFAGCGSGDVFTFEQKREGCSFPASVDSLSQWRGISPEAPKEPRRIMRSFHWIDAEGREAWHHRWNHGSKFS